MASSCFFDPAKIAEVDRFGSHLEFLQHDGMQRWGWPHSYTTLRGATWERGRERGEGRRMMRRGEESSSKGTPSIHLCQTLLQGVSLYRGMGGGKLIPPPSLPRAGGQGMDGEALGHPKTLTLGCPRRMGPLGPIWEAWSATLVGSLPGSAQLRWAAIIY
jgi:hypothetical protein